MATRLKDMVGSGPEALADAVAGSAQQIWQAGLGAFARARQEGGDLFDMLVREGAELNRLTQQAGDGKVGGVADRVSRLAENVGRQASGSWDRIEKIFEDRVAIAMRSLGVPAREEVDALRREVEALRHEAEALWRETEALKAATVRPAPRASAARPASKATAKPAAAKVTSPKRPAKAATGRHA